MGIYDSDMSCWERHRLGLAQDHAGAGVIGEEKKPEVAKEEKAEAKEEVKVEKVEAKAEKVEEPVKLTAAPKKKSFKDKLKGKGKGKK